MKDIVKILITVNIIATIIFSTTGLRIVFSGYKYKNLVEKDINNYARGLIDISIVILAYTILIFTINFNTVWSIIILEIVVITSISVRYRYIKNKYIESQQKRNVN